MLLLRLLTTLRFLFWSSLMMDRFAGLVLADKRCLCSFLVWHVLLRVWWAAVSKSNSVPSTWCIIIVGGPDGCALSDVSVVSLGCRFFVLPGWLHVVTSWVMLVLFVPCWCSFFAFWCLLGRHCALLCAHQCPAGWICNTCCPSVLNVCWVFALLVIDTASAITR